MVTMSRTDRERVKPGLIVTYNGRRCQVVTQLEQRPGRPAEGLVRYANLETERVPLMHCVTTVTQRPTKSR